MSRKTRVGGIAAAAALLIGATAGQALADHVPARPTFTACPDSRVGGLYFSDVAATNLFERPISCLGDYDITRGTTATTYSPAASVSRQQMAQFLYRLGTRAGVSWDTSDAGFTDLGAVTQEARTAINALANADVARGLTASTYGPGQQVQRGQMASFLARLAKAAGADGVETARDFFDDDAGSVHEGAINIVASLGITTGRGADRSYEPAGSVTRQQMAGFLARTLDVLVDQGLAATAYSTEVGAGQTALAELLTVQRLGTSNASGYQTSTVRFLFDAPVTVGAPPRGAFALRTYRGPFFQAESLWQDGERAVVATFGNEFQPVGAAELLQVSVALVAPGAVTDARGRGNPPGTAVLNPGSSSAQAYPDDRENLPAGRTVSADLLRMSVDPAGVVRHDFDAGVGLSTFSPDQGDGTTSPRFDLRLYQPDGTQLTCRNPRLDPSTVDPSTRRGTTVVCEDYGVVGTNRTATPAERLAATLGAASADGAPDLRARPVQSAARRGAG